MKRDSNLLIQVLVAFILCLVLHGASAGQATGNLSINATLNGTVTDLNGNRVPRSHVTVERTGQSCRFQADSLGSFKIQLPPGEYTLRFQADGFARFILTNLVLQAGKDYDEKFSLTPGSCSDCYGFVAELPSPVIYEYDDPRINPPVIVARPEPAYTALAKEHQAEGQVVLRVVLDASGSVKKIVPVKSLPFGLTESAIEAARLVTFQPATSENGPVSSFFTLNYEFSLHNSECHLTSNKTEK